MYGVAGTRKASTFKKSVSGQQLQVCSTFCCTYGVLGAEPALVDYTLSVLSSMMVWSSVALLTVEAVVVQFTGSWPA